MNPEVTVLAEVVWSEELQMAQKDSLALVLGIFALSGELLTANCGMRRVLDVNGGQLAPRDRFVNPSFQQISSTSPDDGIVFEGIMTFGDRRDPGVSLLGRVYRKGKELLVVGEYDVTELARLNNELAQSNREVNTLQRAVVQEKRRLEETLAKLRRHRQC